jgi:hypothetical protein
MVILVTLVTGQRSDSGESTGTVTLCVFVPPAVDRRTLTHNKQFILIVQVSFIEMVLFTRSGHLLNENNSVYFNS